MFLVDLIEGSGNQFYLNCNPSKKGPLTIRVANLRISVYAEGWVCVILGSDGLELQFLAKEMTLFLPLNRAGLVVKFLTKNFKRRNCGSWFPLKGFSWGENGRLLALRIR